GLNLWAFGGFDWSGQRNAGSRRGILRRVCWGCYGPGAAARQHTHRRIPIHPGTGHAEGRRIESAFEQSAFVPESKVCHRGVPPRGGSTTAAAFAGGERRPVVLPAKSVARSAGGWSPAGIFNRSRT